MYGKFTNGDFGGNDCSDPHVRGHQNVGVRGPGHGTTGYCLLRSAELTDGDLDKSAQTARPAGIPVEVAINPSSSTVVTASGITVPPTSFAMRTTPYLSAAQTLIGDLPGIDPALGFPADWINPDTGLPYQLSFGWGASTGGSNEVHEIGQLHTETLNGRLPTFAMDVADSTVAAGSPGTVHVTPRVTSAGGPEGERATVTTTFPSGITPQAGTFTTANGYSCSTTSQVSACRYTPSSPVAAGTSLPVLDIPVAVPSGTSTGSYTLTTKVSSIDAQPATGRGALTVGLPLPGAPTSLSAVPVRSSVLVDWQPPATGQPVARYRVTASPGSATCTTTGLSCVLGGVAGVGYTITVVPVTDGDVDGAPATTTTAGSVAEPEIPATPPADAPLTLTTTDGLITSAEPGQRITVVGTGFLPYSTVTIVIYSTPVTLGTVTTDGAGSFSKLVVVPTTLEAGSHSLVAYGVDPAGNPHSLRLNVTVAAAQKAAQAAKLAFTGWAVAPVQALVVGSALLVTGALVLVAARIRRRSAA